jgi:hypothetical protein
MDCFLPGIHPVGSQARLLTPLPSMNVALYRIFWVERHIHGIVKRSSIAEVTYSANGRRLAGRIGGLIGLRYQLAIGPNERATGQLGFHPAAPPGTGP